MSHYILAVNCILIHRDDSHKIDHYFYIRAQNCSADESSIDNLNRMDNLNRNYNEINNIEIS